MGAKDYDVFGKIRFCKEEQFTHLCLTMEAFSANDALEKAKKISNDVHWLYCKEHVFDEDK